MTTCNGCGKCCDPVTLVYTQLEIMQRPWMVDDRTRDWILNDLTPISRREGLERSPHLTQGGKTAFLHDGQRIVLFSMFYECRWYDRDSRQCTNYENRPSVCADYPWYDDPPDPRKAIPFECSFNADVGKPVRLIEKP